MKTEQKSRVAKITVRWDDQAGVEAGWYAEGVDADGNSVVDSQKIWFGVQVDQFGEDDQAELIEAISAEYPDVEVVTA